MKPTKLLLLASFALAIPAAQAATMLYSHTFNEGTGGLNGTPVDSGTLAPQNWNAFGGVSANGVFNTAVGGGGSSGGSATLAFTPQQGFAYSLDARILDVTGNSEWVGLGFAKGQSDLTDSGSRFVSGAVVGTAWSLFRADNTSSTNTSFNGTGVSGTADGAGWSTLNNSGGSIDLRILLDTTAGSGNWTVTWLAKLTDDATYTTVRATAAVPVANEANYTSVGFAFANGATDGTLQSFSLTQIPEPSAALLGGLGMLALLRRRR